MSVLDYELAIASHLDSTTNIDSKNAHEITEADGAQATLMDITERQRQYGDRPIVIPTSSVAQAKELDKTYSRHALLLRRKTDKDGKEISKQLEIQSKHLRSALKTVMEECSYLNLEAYPIIIKHPYHELFQYRTEIRQYAQQLQNQTSSDTQNAEEETKHLAVLTKFIATNLGKTEWLYDQFAPHGLTNYELLWTYFRPETLIVYQTEHFDEAYRVNSCRYVENPDEPIPYFEITAWSWDYNGTLFGPRMSNLKINSFEGSRKLTELDVYPLDALGELERLRFSQRLIERGRAWRAVLDLQHKEYSGPGWVGPANKQPVHSWNLLEPIYITGRVMVDYKTHQQTNYGLGTTLYTRTTGDKTTASKPISMPIIPSYSTSSSDISMPYFGLPNATTNTAVNNNETSNDAPKLLLNNMKCQLNHPGYQLSDFEAILTPARVRGYALREKRWAFFLVENLREIQWVESRFEELAIEQSWKETIEALVQEHYRAELPLATSRGGGGGGVVIKSELAKKGRGLVVLLYGPPGTGKTLTAESIAELSHRPLYYIGTTDLGKNILDYESGLKTVFDLAAAWNAVLLLDEADIFLRKRGTDGTSDYYGNSIVAAFLRALEYHEGIVFLTTNRLDDFDPAFESRLNLRLRYKTLSEEKRARIWRGEIGRIVRDRGGGEEGLDGWRDEDFEVLGRELEINGRQITNLARTALAISRHRGVPLSVEVLKALHDMNFGVGHADVAVMGPCG